MKKIVLAVALIATAAPAFGQNSIQGWSVTYRKDTFTGQVMPIATVNETGEISRAQLAYECTKGKTDFLFSSGDVSFLADKDTVQIKGDIGSVLSIKYPSPTKPADTDAMKAVIIGTKDAIAYETSLGKQGTFPTVGAAQVFPVVEAACKR